MGASRLEQLQKMLEDCPSDRDLRYFLATEYYRLERYPETLAELEAYFSSGDDEGMGYLMRGTCLYHLGRKEEARSCLKGGIQAALRHHHGDLAADIEEALGDFFPEP